MAIKNEIVDELLKDADPKKVFSSEGLLSEIKKALADWTQTSLPSGETRSI